MGDQLAQPAALSSLNPNRNPTFSLDCVIMTRVSPSFAAKPLNALFEEPQESIVKVALSEADDRVKFFPMKWNENRQQLLYKLFDMYIQAYEYYEKEGWKPNPSNNRCKKCPLTDLQCPHKNEEEAF